MTMILAIMMTTERQAQAVPQKSETPRLKTGLQVPGTPQLFQKVAENSIGPASVPLLLVVRWQKVQVYFRIFQKIKRIVPTMCVTQLHVLVHTILVQTFNGLSFPYDIHCRPVRVQQQFRCSQFTIVLKAH